MSKRKDDTRITRAEVIELARDLDLPTAIQWANLHADGALHAARPPKQIVWQKIDVAERVVLLQKQRMDVALALEDEIFNAYSAAILKHLCAWQFLINTGEIHFAPYQIGREAAMMVDEGYLMRSPMPGTDARGLQVESRSEIQMGQPGTFEFVEAIMGKTYAEWIAGIGPAVPQQQTNAA
jgi:hypothetical protein